MRHLTTTLEVLGNIYFMREDFLRAREVLERACPLMELLPPAAYTNTDHRIVSACFDLLKDVYKKMDNGGNLLDVSRKISDLRLPYNHFLTEKHEFLVNHGNTRHNSKSAINSLQAIFKKFVTSENLRANALEEIRFLLSTLRVCNILNINVEYHI